MQFFTKRCKMNFIHQQVATYFGLDPRHDFQRPISLRLERGFSSTLRMLQSPQFLQPSVLCFQEVPLLFGGDELQPRIYCDLWFRSRRSQYFTQVSKCRHKTIPVNEPYIAHINATEFHTITEPVYTNELLETIFKV
jgi:hypothetical protein